MDFTERPASGKILGNIAGCVRDATAVLAKVGTTAERIESADAFIDQ